MYLYHRKKTGKKMFDSTIDVVVCIALVIAAIAAIVMTANGTIIWF